MKKFITILLVLFYSMSYSQFNTYNINFVDKTQTLDIGDIVTVKVTNGRIDVDEVDYTLDNNNFNNLLHNVNINYTFDYEWENDYKIQVFYSSENSEYYYTVPFTNTVKKLAETSDSLIVLNANDYSKGNKYMKFLCGDYYLYVNTTIHQNVPKDWIGDLSNYCNSNERLPTDIELKYISNQSHRIIFNNYTNLNTSYWTNDKQTGVQLFNLTKNSSIAAANIFCVYDTKPIN